MHGPQLAGRFGRNCTTEGDFKHDNCKRLAREVELFMTKFPAMTSYTVAWRQIIRFFFSDLLE